jgi:hypothetical protein
VHILIPKFLGDIWEFLEAFENSWKHLGILGDI